MTETARTALPNAPVDRRSVFYAAQAAQPEGHFVKGDDRMLFHSFPSQKERREYNGSAFVEMQFCKLPVGTREKEIVAVSKIKNWQNDSLYIDDVNTFSREYRRIFDCGTYNNLQKGAVDIHGINYYAPGSIGSLIEKILQEKPMDYETLVDWLDRAKAYNGFYILGL